MKEPINVSWSEHNYCYHGICPNCNKWITFHHAWQPDEYDEDIQCEHCSMILNVRRWLRRKNHE